jgi:hypothetical protein
MASDRKYFLFASDSYYPAGGARDSEGVFETIEEAEAAYFRGDDSHCMGQEAHIAVVDGSNLKIIRSGFQSVWNDRSSLKWQDAEDDNGK